MSTLKIQLPGFSYPYSKPLLGEMSLELDLAKLYILQGDNGVGKSSFLELISGHLPCRAISLSLDGKQIKPGDSRLYYLPQKASVSLLAVNPAEEIRLWALALRGRASTAELEALREAEPWREIGMRPYAKLSSGQLRLASQMALPYLLDRFWLLDEPFAGLDFSSRQALLSLLKKKLEMGCGALLVSHEAALTGLEKAVVIRLEDGRCIL